VEPQVRSLNLDQQKKTAPLKAVFFRLQKSSGVRLCRQKKLEVGQVMSLVFFGAARRLVRSAQLAGADRRPNLGANMRLLFFRRTATG
jgi:hypothetical protein